MRAFVCVLIAAVMMAGIPGCRKPAMPSLTGPGKFRDITQVRKGMSANEVQRIMGHKYNTIYPDGIQGIDGGNYIWEFAEGRVYFNLEGVTRVQAY